MKIFINPGHGGNDPGACGNGLKERDVALNIGRHVVVCLKNVGYDVILSQIDGLQAICDTSNKWGADLFVSIHCNSFNSCARGTETFYYQFSGAGKKLANCIQRQIVSSLGTVDRGLKTKLSSGYDVTVTKYTDCPAVLIETAFIDNPDDAELLVAREVDFAKAIARGITDFTAKYPLPDTVDR